MLRAVHIFGPLQGQDMLLTAPRETPERLFYAPAPWFPARYILIGTDALPVQWWPDLIEYALDRERSKLTPHPTYSKMEEGTAVYVLCAGHEAAR